MYRCHFCGSVSNPKEPQLRHVRRKQSPRIESRVVQDRRGNEKRITVNADGYREDIEAELPVCKSCSQSLSLGITEDQLIRSLKLAGKYAGNGYKTAVLAKPAKVISFD